MAFQILNLLFISDFFFMKTAGRTSVLYLYYSQRVLHKFDLEKKCFLVSRYVRIKCIIHEKQTQEESGMCSQRNNSVSSHFGNKWVFL